jgi:hypothetical protein
MSMATELLTVVALPHSVATGADFHVSVFVSPRLTPDSAEGKLEDFDHFPHWAKLLAGDAAFELFDQIGPIKVEPILKPLDPDLWDAVFPPATPVRAPRDLDFSDRHWRTFRAAEIHDAAKLLHVVAMFADPTSPPRPSVHPLGRLMGQLGVTSTHRREYDESEITRTLDEAIGETGNPAEVAITLPELEARVDEEDNPLLRLAMQVHRARRFYERPESQRPYRERPLDGATAARPPRPEPDFHERCTLVSDHPALQRRLGLVVDLVADDPDRLRNSEWLSARIVPKGDAKACRTTRTRCQTAGDDLVTVPRTDEWSEERLRLGDAGHFALLDMDPDGTALKLDRFLWTIPRLLAIEANGDPIHAAPTALRSLGFTVVRHLKAVETQNRLEHQLSLVAALGGDNQPLLDTEDVTHGLRIEVWDDTAEAWYTLHATRIAAEVLDKGEVVTDLPEEGFIQGTTATETADVEHSPVHVHESVFGWEGWSLSAARPGKRVRHENGKEVVEDQDANPDPVTPLLVTSEVEPGTLPRLRYGRSYAFRAWAVNLAGWSRSHAVGPVPPPAPPAVDAVAAAAAAPAPAPLPGEPLIPTLRSETAAGVLRRRFTVVEEPSDVAAAELPLLSDPRLERMVLGRLLARRAETLTRARVQPEAAVDRASLVGRAFSDAAVNENEPFVADTALREPERMARALVLPHAEAITAPQLLDLITPLRPFLRWDPVAPPAVVARHRFSSGESLRQLVIRSGVTQDLETLELTIEPPAAYASAHGDLGYRAASERHLAPPKTSQSEAELHGAFDDAIGSNAAADHAGLLAVAVREAGTLFDVDVPRLDDPAQRDPQPGIALVADPTVPASTLKSLPLPTGEPPAPGQYVVHDTDALVLPYLPDVLGRGISLVFPEAGRDRIIAFPFGAEGFTARYPGDWPELQPFRLALEGSDVLSGELDGHVLRIALPAGDVQRFRLASSLDRAELDLFGLWRSLPAVIRSNADVAEAAADGWLWALTPFEEVTLVHAVPRPLETPRPTALVALRPSEGATDVHLLGAVDVHGPSTEMIAAEARWVDPNDDLTLPAPDERATQAIAFTSPIRETEDLAVLFGGAADVELTVPGAGPVWLHSAIQRLGDTKHHTIHYRFRASTRFREYFDPETLAPANGGGPAGPEEPVDDGQSVVGEEITLSVPSSARPAAPVVHSVLPLFRWESGTEAEQPVATRRRRRAGVRIYLERPWYSSGEDELLGVLLAPGGDDTQAHRHPVSQWGADPVWVSAPVTPRAMYLQLDNLLRVFGLEDRPGDALPVAPPATLPLGSIPGSPPVTVLGYRPQYSVDRQMWYVDVAIDPGSTFWPFVRLAVARYQPDSIDGCHLSAPVQCDFVQLTPERITSVSRTDVRHVRVVVSGPIGVRQPPPGRDTTTTAVPTGIDDYAAWVRMHRTVVARLQRLDPAIPTDLGWETVATEELTVRGFGRNVFEAAWIGELEAPGDLPLQTPGANPEWRVTVEEWERLPGDPADLADPRSSAVWEQRLIYADEIIL